MLNHYKEKSHGMSFFIQRVLTSFALKVVHIYFVKCFLLYLLLKNFCVFLSFAIKSIFYNFYVI